MITPLVSVIIATHNRADLLPRAIRSIVNQTYRNIEIIIIDDASHDKSQEVICELLQFDNRIRTYRSETNVGPGEARNIGINHSSGEYIAIMDDDDISIPERLEIQITILNDHTDFGVVFSSVALINNNLEILSLSPDIVSEGKFPTEPDEVFKLLFLEGNRIQNTTLMFRKDVAKKFDAYPSSPWIGEDRIMVMKWAAKNVKMYPITRPLVMFNAGQGHLHLMDDLDQVLRSRRDVIEMIIDWLTSEEINRFNHLYKKALSNQFVREARAVGKVQGGIICIRALLTDPSNNYAWETLRLMIQNGIRKIAKYKQ